MRLMGQSTATVLERYVQPTLKSMERAFERLEAMNAMAAKELSKDQMRQLSAAISAIVGEGKPELVSQVP